MSAFRGHLDVRVLDERDGGRLVYLLLRSLEYESDLLGRVVVVPAGFVTDFESIPRAFAAFTGLQCPRTGVVHDWLYQSHELGEDEPARQRSDAVGREAWTVEGLDDVRADQRLASVDFWGKEPWRSGPERRRVLPV
jgi:hypothetical protein